jgi:hypothetical protein
MRLCKLLLEQPALWEQWKHLCHPAFPPGSKLPPVCDRHSQCCHSTNDRHAALR